MHVFKHIRMVNRLLYISRLAPEIKMLLTAAHLLLDGSEDPWSGVSLLNRNESRVIVILRLLVTLLSQTLLSLLPYLTYSLFR